MARTTATLAGGRRLSDYVTLGVVSLTVPTALVDEVLAETGRQSRRYRQLPARLVVYYVMALALFAQASSGEVLRCLLEGVRWLRWRGEGVRLASKAALTKARVRLGPAPLRLLYGRIARPLAPATVPGAWYRGRRLVSLDGTTLEVPDTPDLEARFGRPKASRGTSSFPQLRLLGLMEIGTRALFRVVFDRYDVGEVTLAERILDQLQAGMLCLADRGFVGFALWQAASATGADLLWRVRRNQRLPCWQRLPDGSYLSRLHASAKDRRQDRNGLVVRVIEYRLTGLPKAEPLYRLITTLLDPVAAPAVELAALYHERWEAETAFAELKVTLPGERLMLRSRRVDLVEQELYGLLLVHFALRRLMVEASQQTGGDPDTLSFLHTVQVVRRHLPFHAAFSPSAPSADDRPDPVGDPGRARRAASTARQPPGGQAQDEQLPDQGPRQGRAPDTVADRRRAAH
jgi:hypothetical protein